MKGAGLMDKTQNITEKLIIDFIMNYMDKLFYFCLKKTGSSTDAEDLTQDIALNIVASLNKGIVPINFSAWIWKIAHNRYSLWADSKHRRYELISGVDISYCEIEDNSESMLNCMIKSEQLSCLRRELAFISSEYRNILVAYYFDELSISDISQLLSLSIDTVKKRLQRARKMLKEGMDMAREFGSKSYKPEEVYYTNNCSKPGNKNQPYSIMEHKIYKNILLQAYGNPSNAETFSLELGVALPYMEDELEYLTRETFLIKKDKKYQTAFPIISASAQEKSHVAQLNAAYEISAALMNFVDKLNDVLKEKGYTYYGPYQDYESAKWTLIMLAYDYFLYKKPHIRDYTERPDNGRWDIIGYQSCNISEPKYVGNNGSHYGFQQFKYFFDEIADRTPDWLTDEESKVLHDFIIGKTEINDTNIIADLLKYGYLRKKGEIFCPDVVILNIDEINNIVKALDNETISELTQLADVNKNLLKSLYHEISKIVKSDLPDIFSNDEYQSNLAISCCYFARGYVMNEVLKSGWLLPANQVSPAIGAHFYI